MNLNNFQSIFKSLSNKFPMEECIIKDKKEEAVYNSDKWYLCMIIDKRFSDNVSIKIMQPYIWKSSESKLKERFDNIICYGWIDKYNNCIDNFENPINGDCYDEYVIGFTKYKNNYKNDDIKLWNMTTK